MKVVDAVYHGHTQHIPNAINHNLYVEYIAIFDQRDFLSVRWGHSIDLDAFLLLLLLLLFHLNGIQWNTHRNIRVDWLFIVQEMWTFASPAL